MEIINDFYMNLFFKLNPIRKRLLKRVVFLFPIIIIFFFLFLKIVFNEIYHNMIQEDSLIEHTQSAAYFCSFIFALLIAISFFKTKNNFHGFLYLILSLAFIFICGEEISWGQRIFNIPTSEYFHAHNIQKEITLHNLDFIFLKISGVTLELLDYVYVLIGFFGAFAWLMLPEKIQANHNFSVTFFIPDWFLTFYFFPVFGIYFIFGFMRVIVDWFRLHEFYSYWFVVYIEWKDQELAELLLSFGFLFFVIINKYRQGISNLTELKK